MADLWSGFQHFIMYPSWLGVFAISAVVGGGLAFLGRVSTHPFGPFSGVMFVLLYAVCWKWIFAPAIVSGQSSESALTHLTSAISFLPKAFIALIALLLIIHIRRHELEAQQRRRNRRASDALDIVLRQSAEAIPDITSEAFCLYLRPFASTNELPVQFDHGRHTLIGERIDLENILRLSVADRGLLVAIGRSEDDIIGADRLETSDDWQEKVARLIERARIVFVLPSHHDGTLWEVAFLVRTRQLAKCIWIMPECVPRGGMQTVVTPMSINWFSTSADQAAMEKMTKEWSRATDALAAYGLDLPDYRAEGLFFKFDETGTVIAREELNLRNTFLRVRKVGRQIARLGFPPT